MRLCTVVLIFVCLSVPRVTGAQNEFRSGHFTTSDGVELHYLEAGAGPTLVLVPGWTMPAWMWEHQLRHFASMHRVVALDPRGHGRSEKVAHGYYSSRRGQDIGELIEHLGDERVVLAGWSLGVQEVVVYLEESGTDAIRAVVLVDWDVDTDLYAEDFTSRFVSLQTQREEWKRDFIQAIHQSPQSEAYFERLTEDVLAVPPNATAIMIANLILMPTNIRPTLDALDRPVLYVYSSLGWAVEAAEQVRERWPEARVEVIDGTSHALFVDQPEAFNRVLEAFLATLPD